MSKCAFVRKSFAWLDERTDFCFLHGEESAWGAIDETLFQTNVQQFPFSYNVFVLREEEVQFRQLDTKGNICSDDIWANILCIVFSHKSRWYVDSYHLCLGGVDVFHYCGKTAIQRFVQPTAE